LNRRRDCGPYPSGTARDTTFFDFGEFTGYRVDPLADLVMMAQDNNALTIPEAEFATAVVSISIGSELNQFDRPRVAQKAIGCSENPSERVLIRKSRQKTTGFETRLTTRRDCAEKRSCRRFGAETVRPGMDSDGPCSVKATVLRHRHCDTRFPTS
jgi:hypothetical protein